MSVLSRKLRHLEPFIIGRGLYSSVGHNSYSVVGRYIKSSIYHPTIQVMVDNDGIVLLKYHLVFGSNQGS